jgi:hypothetical protein
MTTTIGTAGNDAIVAHPAVDYEKGQLVFVLGGIPAGGQWPEIGILINGQWTSVVTVDAPVLSGTTETVTIQLPAGPITSVGLHYFNDGIVGTEDRNLYVGSATLNGVDLPLSQGTYAIDGDVTIQGQSDIYRNGTLSWSGSVVANAMATSTTAQNNDITGNGGTDTVIYSEKELPYFDFKYQLDGSMTVSSFLAGFTDTLHGVSNILFDDGGNATVNASGNVIDGGGGLDTLVLNGHRDMYYLTPTTTGMSIYGNGVNEWVTNVERLQFTNGYVGLDIHGDSGMAYRIYQAAFDRAPDSGGLGFWINAMDKGMGLEQVAANFVASAEFQTKYGALTNDQFVTQIYENVLHRAPDPGGLAFWDNVLNTGEHTRAWVLAGFSESAENQANLVGAMQNGVFFDHSGW